MASTILTGSDFVANDDRVQVDGEGRIFVDNISSSDYLVAAVSRDAFDFTTGNKSAKFVFTASPYTPASRRGVYASGEGSRFVYLVNDDSTVSWEGLTLTNTCPGTPDCMALSAMECEYYYGAAVSSSHSIIKTGSCIGTDGANSYGELDVVSPETVKQYAAGLSFTAILRESGLVEVIGDDQAGTIVVPVSISTFDEETKPISIVAGEDFVAVLRRNGVISAFGSISGDDLSGNLSTAITAGTDFIIATALDGTMSSFGETFDVPAGKILKVSASSSRAVALLEDGSVVEWGQGLTGFVVVTSNPADSIIIDVMSGDSFSISILNDGTAVISGTAPSYLDPLLAGTSGGLSVNREMSDDYDYFPMLRDKNGINIAFGIQNDAIDGTYHKYVALDSSIKPIITGRDGYDSVFSSMRGAIKGAIVAKVFNGSDMSFDMRGVDFDPFTASGHQPISDTFITSTEEEKYEVIVSFSAFGKSIKYRKVSGEFAQDMPFKHLSIEETGYAQGRLALYIRNANNFILEYCEVTDEMDTGILPAEILYRDIDTAVLHTKAAQLVVDLADSIEAVQTLASKNSDAILTLNSDYKTQLGNITSRLETLEA